MKCEKPDMTVIIPQVLRTLVWYRIKEPIAPWHYMDMTRLQDGPGLYDSDLRVKKRKILMEHEECL